MTLDIFKEKGTPLDKQLFTWREMVQAPTSKLDDDAFTRVRIILMNGLESDRIRTSHAMARMMDGQMRLPLAKIRRIEQHQQTLVNWLLPADLSPIETTIGFEQVAIEVTASVALREPDDYLAQVYRFGLLEDFDHLYRFSALMDRVMGQDANNIAKITATSCRDVQLRSNTAHPKTTCAIITTAPPQIHSQNSTPQRSRPPRTRRTTTT